MFGGAAWTWLHSRGESVPTYAQGDWDSLFAGVMMEPPDPFWTQGCPALPPRCGPAAPSAHWSCCGARKGLREANSTPVSSESAFMALSSLCSQMERRIMRLWPMSFVEAPGRPLRAKPTPIPRSWGHHSLVPQLLLWPVGSRPPFSPDSAVEWPGSSQKQRGNVFQEVR